MTGINMQTSISSTTEQTRWASSQMLKRYLEWAPGLRISYFQSVLMGVSLGVIWKQIRMIKSAIMKTILKLRSRSMFTWWPNSTILRFSRLISQMSSIVTKTLDIGTTRTIEQVKLKDVSTSLAFSGLNTSPHLPCSDLSQMTTSSL